MTLYLLLKTLHVISSVVLVGTGFGTAFYLFFANRSDSLHAQAVVSRLVVRADLWFTTPAVILQPLTGWLMMREGGWPMSTPWIVAAAGLYVLAGLCWLPVVWLQWRMAQMAHHAMHHGAATLPPDYARYARWWEALGYPAFIAMVMVFALMVMKPQLW